MVRPNNASAIIPPGVIFAVIFLIELLLTGVIIDQEVHTYTIGEAILPRRS